MFIFANIDKKLKIGSPILKIILFFCVLLLTNCARTSKKLIDQEIATQQNLSLKLANKATAYPDHKVGGSLIIVVPTKEFFAEYGYKTYTVCQYCVAGDVKVSRGDSSEDKSLSIIAEKQCLGLGEIVKNSQMFNKVDVVSWVDPENYASNGYDYKLWINTQILNPSLEDVSGLVQSYKGVKMVSHITRSSASSWQLRKGEQQVSINIHSDKPCQLYNPLDFN